MIDKKLQDPLSLILIRICLRGKYAISAIADANGVTAIQAITLCVLEPNTPFPMSHLANFLSCDLSSVSGIVERLVASDFVERREWAQDRRVKTITLTAKGNALRHSLLEVAMEKRLPYLNRLTQQETAQLLKLLIKATEKS